MKLYKKASPPAVTTIRLPGSKSISHRALIASDLCGMPIENIQGLSDCNDTQYLLRALHNQQQETHDFGDGATPLHFFMALAAAKNKSCILTGSERLMQRPHGDLIELLGQCGTIIKQTPQGIIIEKGILSFRTITADTSKSSQHISAMMLVAPLIPGQKEILLTGKPTSFPYIKLTADILKLFGVQTTVSEQKIIVEEGVFKAPTVLNIEPDWSSAAFFYSFVACQQGTSILFKGLKLQSFQGDSAIASFYKDLGVSTEQTAEGALISRNGQVNTHPVFNLRHHPDCAPALLAACAYLRIEAVFSGLENLTAKESDRLQVMKDNLQAAGISIVCDNGTYRLIYDNPAYTTELHIQTHNDHRIAMAMAVFGLKYDVIIDNENCVNKSFPCFWQQWGHWFHTDH